MSQDFKMDTRLAQDLIESLASKKMSDYTDKTLGEFMTDVRSSLGMSGFSHLDQSKENELELKIKELETDRDKKAEEYKELLEPIQKAIDSKLL